jgi:hypothetical protein
MMKFKTNLVKMSSEVFEVLKELFSKSKNLTEK